MTLILQDELLLWIKDARDHLIHGGEPSLSFRTVANTSNIGAPPHPDARLVINPEGRFWELPGPPGRRQLVRVPSPGVVTTVQAINPPKTHLGEDLLPGEGAPFQLCEIAFQYYVRLIDEVSFRFQTL